LAWPSATYMRSICVLGVLSQHAVILGRPRVVVGEGTKIACPMLHLWAQCGPLDSFYERDGGALGIWRKWAPEVQRPAMKGGHFFPEENPTETAEVLSKFLTAKA
jgi:hypothetical protein